jgi:hypothetical protein
VSFTAIQKQVSAIYFEQESNNLKHGDHSLSLNETNAINHTHPFIIKTEKYVSESFILQGLIVFFFRFPHLIIFTVLFHVIN